MRNELKIFLTAVMFFTKIPCPSWVDHSPEYLNKSTRYFSLVGIIVGSIGAVIFWLFSNIFQQSIAVLLSMLATIWLTGAFHEDGLADMFDGFGGGWTKEDILKIMKDSRVGTFGVVGLVGILSLKFLSLNTLPAAQIPLLLISGHALSRFLAVTLNRTHDYARAGDSKAKPVATELPPISMVISAFFGLIPLIFFSSGWIILALVPPVLIRIYLGYFFKKWIGGYSGDCSGGTQQLTEVAFYLSVILIF